MKIFNILIILLIICFCIISVVGVFLYSNYQNKYEQINNVDFIRLADKSLLQAYELLENTTILKDYSILALKIDIGIIIVLALVITLKILKKKTLHN